MKKNQTGWIELKYIHKYTGYVGKSDTLSTDQLKCEEEII